MSLNHHLPQSNEHSYYFLLEWWYQRLFKLFAMKNSRLAICITVHFSADRMKYLKVVSDHFAELAETVEVFIVTNAQADQGEIKILDDTLKDKGFKYEFFIPQGLGHPYLLTWSHFVVFKRLIDDKSITHFMYLEDDLLVTKENMDYWNESLETLQPLGLIPSFLRIEKNYTDSLWYSSDAQEQFYFQKLPKVFKNLDYVFINLPHPYQGMYLLTRELMLEHLNGKSSNPDSDSGGWFIREKAAQGLTFQNVPEGYTSRNLVGFNLINRKFDPRSFIHHLPDNYANQRSPHHTLGSIQVDNVILMQYQGIWLKKRMRKISQFLGLKPK
jgi:hypothetical protein